MTSPYDSQINSLYAKYGKTGDQIDQTGRDFWAGELAQGKDIDDAFRNSATDVYANNQFATGNQAGYGNWTGNLTDDQVVDYNRIYGQGGGEGSAGWESMDPTLRASIMSGNVDVNTLSDAQRASIPSASVMYGGMDDNHPNGVYSGQYDPNAGNPYLSGRADDIQRRTMDMLGQGMASIQGQSVGNGSLGGTRQGVAQGQGMAKAADFMSGQLANMYSNDWNQDQGRKLQKYGMDQNFYLGDQGQNQGFYTAQRGQDLQATGLGASLWGLGNTGEWTGLQQFGNVASPYSGYGSTTSGSGGGTDWGAGLGAGLATYQTGVKNNWWGG